MVAQAFALAFKIFKRNFIVGSSVADADADATGTGTVLCRNVIAVHYKVLIVSFQHQEKQS